jgi:hypothetical protein
MNGIGVRDGHGEHHADHGQLDHRDEGLIIVDIGSLGEAVKDLASHVPFQGVVRVELVLEDPFASDDIRASGARDNILGVVGDQGSKFFFHDRVPVRFDDGDVDGEGHR